MINQRTLSACNNAAWCLGECGSVCVVTGWLWVACNNATK